MPLLDHTCRLVFALAGGGGCGLASQGNATGNLARPACVIGDQFELLPACVANLQLPGERDILLFFFAAWDAIAHDHIDSIWPADIVGGFAGLACAGA